MASAYVVDGLGKSPIDFSVDTLVLYLNGSLPFTGDEETLYYYLATVMGRDILDALRSSARKTTEKVPAQSGTLDEGGATVQGLDDFDTGFSVDALVQGDIFKERLYALLEGPEPELYELVFAVFEENALTPKEIADVIRTTPTDVQNRKKRLRTFLAKHNVMSAPKRN